MLNCLSMVLYQQPWPATLVIFCTVGKKQFEPPVVIGLVGAGGLGRLLTDQIVAFNYPGVLATLLVFITLTVTVDFVSATARRDFRAV